MLKGLSAKVKKHIGTVGYYGVKQAEEMAKVEAFVAENKIDNVEINIAIQAVKSCEMTAEAAIEKIDGILGAAYAEVKAIEKAQKDEADKIAKANAKVEAEKVAVTTGEVAVTTGEVATPSTGTISIQ